MERKFNVDEVFELAEQIERNGGRFYRKVADQTKDPERVDLLLRLAAMEDEHEKVFTRLRAETAQAMSNGSFIDPDNQAILYLRAIADGHVFDSQGDPEELIQGAQSMAELLRRAIVLEKDSIVFYVGIKHAMPQSWDPDRIDAIILEEMKHVTTLTQELSALAEGA